MRADGFHVFVFAYNGLAEIGVVVVVSDFAVEITETGHCRRVVGVEEIAYCVALDYFGKLPPDFRGFAGVVTGFI